MLREASVLPPVTGDLVVSDAAAILLMFVPEGFLLMIPVLEEVTNLPGFGIGLLIGSRAASFVASSKNDCHICWVMDKGPSPVTVGAGSPDPHHA